MNFERVSLCHRELVERYMRSYGEGSCQHSFPAMYCLADKYGDSICEEDNWLFTLRALRSGNGYRTYLFPMGEGDLAQAMELLTADARIHGAKVRFETVTADAKSQLDALYPGRFSALEDRDMWEYLYERERIAALSGHGLSTKRYESRAFWRKFGERASVTPITSYDIEEIREFQALWLASKQEDPNWIHLVHENTTIGLSLSDFDELGLFGIVLRIDGKVCGFAYGCRLTSDCFDMVAEKGDRSILGIYSVLNQEFASCCKDDCRYLNWEEDVAVPGLRQAKLSYKPDILLQKYIVSEGEMS